MKPRFKKIAFLLFLGIILLGIEAVAVEKTKVYREKWTASSVQTLQVINKFGEVKVTNSGGSEVTIDVRVIVEATSESKANELLDMITVNFSKTGGTVKAETEIEPGFKSHQKFSINYIVNIPPDKNLNISNKYGNTIVNELKANGEFAIQYGNFTANKLIAPIDGAKKTGMAYLGQMPVPVSVPNPGAIKVYLAYGKSEISIASDISVDVKYATMNFGEMRDLNLLSRYSVVNIAEAKAIKIDSKYDTFNFEKVEALEAVAKYSHFKITELKKRLKIDSGYGGIRVAKVYDDFESISIQNSYGQIKLGLGTAGYSLDASCNYCGISYPESNFSGNRVSENQTKNVIGKVGKKGEGKVYIRSRYGEISLDD